jgi:hypothetical protein
MRFKLISCEVLYREMCDSVARSPHQVDVEFLSKGLHDLGGKAMRQALQEKIDAVSPDSYDAVLMGYALCGNGLHGLEARALPLVIARAHDCIALLMGSRERYAEFFEANPGTYFRSTGWIERGKSLHQLPVGRTANGASLDDLIERYGEENGRYLFEEFTRYQQHYRRLTYIESGLEPDAHFEEEARREAATRGWEFSKLPGNPALFHQLVNGEWPEKDFLVVPPGGRIAASYDENVIRVEPPVERKGA